MYEFHSIRYIDREHMKEYTELPNFIFWASYFCPYNAPVDFDTKTDKTHLYKFAEFNFAIHYFSKFRGINFRDFKFSKNIKSK